MRFCFKKNLVWQFGKNIPKPRNVLSAKIHENKKAFLCHKFGENKRQHTYINCFTSLESLQGDLELRRTNKAIAVKINLGNHLNFLSKNS